MASGPTGIKAIPWRLVLEVAALVVNRFRDDLPPADRRKLTALVRKSKGDPRRLTGPERRQVLELLKQVDRAKLGKDVSAVVGANRLRKRLRR